MGARGPAFLASPGPDPDSRGWGPAEEVPGLGSRADRVPLLASTILKQVSDVDLLVPRFNLGWWIWMGAGRPAAAPGIVERDRAVGTSGGAGRALDDCGDQPGRLGCGVPEGGDRASEPGSGGGHNSLSGRAVGDDLADGCLAGPLDGHRSGRARTLDADRGPAGGSRVGGLPDLLGDRRSAGGDLRTGDLRGTGDRGRQGSRTRQI